MMLKSFDCIVSTNDADFGVFTISNTQDIQLNMHCFIEHRINNLHY